VAFVVVLLTLLGVAEVPARADRALAGRIVWSRFDADFSSMALVSSAPDGTEARQLTNSAGAFDADPVISPDGTLVTFLRVGADGSGGIGVVGVNGGPVRLLTMGCVDPCAGGDQPSWTPDGNRLVFTLVVGPVGPPNDSAASAVLYSANLDGADVRRLSETGIDGVFEDYHARFSPDGSYLTFVRVRNADMRSAVFRMRPDGTDVRQLTPWDLDADLPDLSPALGGPTKGVVVFETYGHGAPTGSTQRVATVPADCRSLSECTRRIRYVTPVLEEGRASFNPSWAPDGRGIAYVEYASSPDAAPLADIWTVRFDGGKPRQVTDSPLFDFRPDWGSTG
jgi:Tol biopolymer transport system component